MLNTRVKKLVLASLFLALCMILPFFTMQIPEIGSMLLPMHLPVLLCGFLVGWPYALAIGFIAPVMRSLFLTMPPMFPTAIGMAFEMATYGLVCGVLYSKAKHTMANIYAILIAAMVVGRIVWGCAQFAMLGFSATAFPMSAFLSGALLTAIPGIIVQLILVPILVKALEKQGLNKSTS